MYQRSLLRHRTVPRSLRSSRPHNESQIWFPPKPKGSDIWIATSLFALVVVGVLIAALFGH